MGFPVAVGLTYGEEKRTSNNKQGRQLGTRGVLRDGRVFRWAKNGGVDLTQANLVSTAVLVNSGVEAAMDIDVGTNVSGVATVTVVWTCSVIKAAFAEGTLTVATSPGFGTYKIKSNAAGVTTAAGSLVLEEDDKLRELWTSGTTKIGLHRNPYTSVVVNASSPAGSPIGVAPVLIAASTATVPVFFWLQTWGKAGLKTDTAPVPQERLTVSSVSPGAVIAATTGVDLTRPTVAWAEDTGSGADGITEVFLTIAP